MTLRLRLRARTRVKAEVECGVWRVRRGPLVARARVGLIGCGVVWYHRLIAGGAGRGRRVPMSSPTRILTP